jgi:DNA-binding MarR family transcriptional regulator
VIQPSKKTGSVRTMYLVRRLQLRAREVIENALHPLGLTASQYTALSMLGRREGLSSAQLARRFGVMPQSMTEIIKSLGQKGLISRQELDSNRRVLQISLTTAGRQCLNVCDALVDCEEDHLFAVLDGAELAMLRQLLRKLVGPRSSKDVANPLPAQKTASRR